MRKIRVTTAPSMSWDRDSRAYEDMVRAEAAQLGYAVFYETLGYYLRSLTTDEFHGPYLNMRSIRGKLHSLRRR